jgi:flagellar biosynthetic protein FlhB
MDVDESTQLLLNICGRLLLGLSISVGFLAGADYLYQRFVFLRDQRMTLQEVKDEMRNSEGDPMIKARLKQIRRQRAKKRMMAAVPKSTVVITNPTHFAVALKFEMGKMEAPILVAKGMDEVARRIRAVALENSVPILENPPLARALHKDVELEQEIPMEHYQAVAEIIGYILRLKGKVRSQGPAVPPPGSRLRRD